MNVDFNPNTNYVPTPPPPQNIPTTPPPPAQQPPPPSSLSSGEDFDLKQVVEDLAIQNNLTFLPTRRRHENGAQVS